MKTTFVSNFVGVCLDVGFLGNVYHFEELPGSLTNWSASFYIPNKHLSLPIFLHLSSAPLVCHFYFSYSLGEEELIQT